MTDKQKDIQNTRLEQSTNTTHILHSKQHSEHKIRAKNQYNSQTAQQISRHSEQRSKQSTSTTYLLHNRQAERCLGYKIKAINQYNSHPARQSSRKTIRIQNQSNQSVQLTNCMADNKKTFRTQYESNQPVQLTNCMADKQKDIQNTKSEQSISTTHILHGRQYSEHKIRAIN